jgi:hypothetical protein
MSRGELQCLGSSSFLKHKFGAGYKLIFTMEPPLKSATVGEIKAPTPCSQFCPLHSFFCCVLLLFPVYFVLLRRAGVYVLVCSSNKNDTALRARSLLVCAP